MKKIFFFASAMVAALAMNAQTIVIDGNKSDWANIPMLTEPGVFPMLKVVVPQEGLNLGEGAAFAAMLELNEDIAKVDAPVLYVDADKNASTGSTPWVLPALGYDYEMASWRGTADMNGHVWEMSIPTTSFDGTAKFTGTFNTSLTYQWGVFYIPAAPSATLQNPLDPDSWNWGEEKYHPFFIEPFTIADLNGKHAAADTKLTHACLALGSSFNFNVSGGAQDTAFWAAWPVELKNAGVFNVVADITSANTASCDLYLVDMGTNQVVASLISSDIATPSATTDLGAWDLSAVPAGKYMLKMMNHVKWSEMVLNSVTLTKQGGTGFNPAATVAAPAKMIKNGRFMINNNGKYINAMGF